MTQAKKTTTPPTKTTPPSKKKGRPVVDADDDVEVTTSGVDWNELFTADVIAHKTRQREGGLGQWEYSYPRSDDDLVRGSELWVKFLETNPNYYIMDAEIELANIAAEQIPGIVPEPVALAFLGMGNRYALKRKDLRVTDQFTRVTSITTFDISTEYTAEAMRVLEKARPGVSKRGGQVTNIFDGIEIPKGGVPSAKVVATMFGATLFNVDAERDAVGDLVVPEKEIRERLKAIRRSLAKGDVFITTHDANMDKEKVEKAYAGQTEFASNLVHRILRDTPYKSVDPANTNFRVSFDEASGVLGHYLTIDFNDNGGPEEYLVNISVKVPPEMFLEWCRKERFKPALSLEHNGVHLHALEAC